jgi:hypothetical protein
MSIHDKNEFDEFDVWLEKACEGTLDDADAASLNLRLEHDDEAKARYVRFMKMHGRLNRLLANPDGHFSDWMVRAAADANLADREPLSDSVVLNGGLLSSWLRRSKESMMGAVLAVSAMVLLATWLRSSYVPSIVASSEQRVNSGARILKKVDCTIESNRWEKNSSDQVASGESITLSKGFLTLEFGCGAVVRLEGPAEFEVLSDHRGYLHFGKLSARAEKEINGFRIETPAGEIVDLGTEFGVSVDGKGVAETHVFEGEVLVIDNEQSLSESRDNGRLVLANQAVRLGSARDGSAVTEVTISRQSFLRIAGESARQLGEFSRPGTTANRLVMWLDAGRDVQMDEYFRVVAWPDLAISESDADQTAWQVEAHKRPYFITDAIHSKPGIRFMGREFLITEPLSTGDNVSIFVVAKFLPHDFAPHRLASLLHFGSHRKFTLSRQLDDSVLARVYGAWENGTEGFGATLKSPRFANNEPFVLGFSYSRSENLSTIFVNETVVAKDVALLDLQMSKPRLIGSQDNGQVPFVGDIAELMVFDSALSESESLSIARSLVEKYQIKSTRRKD